MTQQVKIVQLLHVGIFSPLSLDGTMFSCFITLSVIVGASAIVSVVFRLCNFFWRQYGRPLLQSKNRLFELYGSGTRSKATWAAVTGGSDGIGLAMCRNLAAQGFNILIIARNKDKMKEKLQDLVLEFPHIKTGHIVADFGQLKTIEDYKKVVEYEMEFYDIGVLALNAGVGTMGPFEELTDKEVESIVNVNALHVIYMTKIMVPTFVERFKTSGKKGAIIVTSSGLGSRPISGTITYSATKSFASFIAEGLNHEFKDKIDFLSYQAGETAT